MCGADAHLSSDGRKTELREYKIGEAVFLLYNFFSLLQFLLDINNGDLSFTLTSLRDEEAMD